jgi:hypothetical protein
MPIGKKKGFENFREFQKISEILGKLKVVVMSEFLGSLKIQFETLTTHDSIPIAGDS